MSISLSIVEDLDEVREGLKQFISLNPEFKVLDTFKTAEEALYDIPRLQPDIVIMDINLPGMNGIECIKQIKTKVPRTQFMMFTVYENDEKVFEALKAGASGYLLKNTGLMQLIEALQELHNGGSPMSANIARKLVTVFREKKIAKFLLRHSVKEKQKFFNYYQKVYCIKKLLTNFLFPSAQCDSISIRSMRSFTFKIALKPSTRHLGKIKKFSFYTD